MVTCRNHNKAIKIVTSDFACNILKLHVHISGLDLK